MSSDKTDSDFAFPHLYQQWKDHDLADHGPQFGSYRPWFYEGLNAEDELRIWRFIEENYLLKYEDRMAVRFDWFSSGLWSIPFPGSVADKWNFGDLEGMGLSARARKLLKEWHDPLDERPLEGGDNFDHEASDARGLAAAKEVKRSLGEKIYLEFEPFQELVIDHGQASELKVPDFILNIRKSG